MSYEKNETKVALSRGSFYGFLTEAFIRLPDEDFIKRITSAPMKSFLDQIKGIDHSKLRAGAAMVLGFSEGITPEHQRNIMEAMAVDRTRLIRSAGRGRLKAPYEGLYKKKEEAHIVLLHVKNFYQRLGIIPISYANDAPDFFCTELDFMKQLCLLEASAHSNTAEVRRMEKEFLSQHLGSWIGDYCKAAGEVARTDFYKGLLLLLDGFMELEKSYDSEETD